MYIGIDTFDWFVTLLHYLFLNENRFGFWLPELPISCKSNKRQSAVFSPADHRLRIAQISGQFSSPRSWNSVDCICNHTIICHRGSQRLPPAVCLAEGLATTVRLLSAQDKICLRWSSGKRKIRAVWTLNFSKILYFALVNFSLMLFTLMILILLHDQFTVSLLHCYIPYWSTMKSR